MCVGDLSRRAPVTLADVAATTGVSVKTVSLAMSGHPSVSEDTTRRILEAALRMGYVTSRRGRKVLGVIAPHIGHRVYADIIGGIDALASAYGYMSIVAESGGDPHVESRFIDEFGHRRIDGLILISPRLSPIEIEKISRPSRPVVTVNLPAANTPFTFGSVEINNRQGAFQGTKYLVDRGHHAIAYLAGRLPSSSDQQRRAGYLEAIEGGGHLVVELGDYTSVRFPTYQDGYDQCVELLSRSKEVDGILAYNDVVAIGALSALSDRGRDVPGDISLVSFDNLLIGQFVRPQLTSVGVQRDAIAWQAIQTLFSMTTVENGRLGANELHRMLQPMVIERESVRDRRFTAA